MLMGDLAVLRRLCLAFSTQLSLSSILILCQRQQVQIQIADNTFQNKYNIQKVRMEIKTYNLQKILAFFRNVNKQIQIYFSLETKIPQLIKQFIQNKHKNYFANVLHLFKQYIFYFMFIIICISIYTLMITGVATKFCLMPLQEVFQGTITGYEVKIHLNSEGMVFLLCNNHRKRYYQARIPYILQGLSKEIQKMFVNLDEFFLYITTFSEDKDRVAINETGTIIVTHMIQKTQKLLQNNPPRIRIQTEVLMTGMQIKNQAKLHNQISEVKRQNLQLQNKINQLMKLNESNQAQIEKLRIMMNKKVARYRDSSESSSSSQSRERSHDKKKKKKKKKFSVISNSKSGIVQLNTAVQELEKEVEGIKGIFEAPQAKKHKKRQDNSFYIVKNIEATQAAIFGKKMKITVDPNNQYLQRHYKIDGNLITKINGYGRYQLLSREVIPLIGKHYFVMYIEKISYYLFSLGIVNQKCRNLPNSHRNANLISYFSKTGAIWEYGDCRNGGPQIPNGVEIRIVVDMDRFNIIWYMDKKEIATARIGEHLRGQRLVAYLQFNYEGDQVYWNQRTKFTTNTENDIKNIQSNKESRSFYGSPFP